MTGRGLAKLCDRRQVPVPPRGYWMRSEAERNQLKIGIPAFAKRPAKPGSRLRKVKLKIRRSAVQDAYIAELVKEADLANAPPPPTRDYRFRVESWGWNYSVGMQGRKPERDAAREDVYPECEHIHLDGVLQEPAELVGRPVVLSVVPVAGYAPPLFRDTKRASIGAIEFADDQCVARAAVPESAAARLLQILIAGQTLKVTLTSEPDGEDEEIIATISFETEHAL